MPEDPAEHDAVRKAYEAVRRAEELQKELQNPQRLIDRYVDGMEGLSAHKRAFLKANPLLLDQGIMPIAGAAWQQGLAQGVVDDTPEMNRHILQAVCRGIEAQRQMPPTPPAVGPVPPPAQMPAYDRAEVERLQAEAAERLQAMKMPAPLLPIATPRRSLPVSAPVSRDIPLPSGRKLSQETTITLSPEEREIAHRSFGPIKDRNGNLVDLTNAEKELKYAQGKAKMLDLRRRGLLNEPPR